MQEVAHVASKVEKLLAEVQAASPGPDVDGPKSRVAAAAGAAAVVVSGASSGAGAGAGAGDKEAVSGDLDAHARMLERVAAEVSRLSFLANKGKVRRAFEAGCFWISLVLHFGSL